MARCSATHALRSLPPAGELAFVGDFETRNFLAPNVVGVIEGCDPRLKDLTWWCRPTTITSGLGPEMADDSHLQRRRGQRPRGGRRARDRSGRSPIDRGPPRRSIIFLFTTAEEAGNLGSSYFLDHRPIPLPRIVGQRQHRRFGLLREPSRTWSAIGGELSDLGGMLDGRCRRRALRVTRPSEIMSATRPSPDPTRSRFAEAGVPSILVSEGFDWRTPAGSEPMRPTRDVVLVRHLPHAAGRPATSPWTVRRSAALRRRLGPGVDRGRCAEGSPRRAGWMPGPRTPSRRLVLSGGRGMT